jgi:autotransporter-associated beta strand protein
LTGKRGAVSSQHSILRETARRHPPPVATGILPQPVVRFAVVRFAAFVPISSAEAIPAMSHSTFRSIFVAFIAAALSGNRAAAQTPTNTWIATTTTGNWSGTGNWDTNSQPASAATTVLQFNNSGSLAYTATQDIANPFLLNGLIFNSSSTGTTTINNLAGDSFSFVANGGAGPFLFQNSTGAAIIGTTGTVAFAANSTFGGGGTGSVTISSPTTFSGGVGLTLAGFNTTTVSGTISLPSSSAFTIAGNGIGNVALTGVASGAPTAVTINSQPNGFVGYANGFVQLSGLNTFTATGGVNLQSGVLAIGGAGTATTGALGNGNPLNISGGVLRASAAATVFNPISMSNTDLIFAGTTAATLNGAISVASGASGLQVLGSGALTIQNSAGFNGATTVGVPGLVTGALTIGSTATTTGSLAASAVTVSTAAASTTSGNLVLTNATAVSNNRISSTAPITLNSGRLTYVSASGANSQAFGPLTINGFGGIGTQTTNAGTALTFNSLALPNNATIGIRGSIGTGSFSTINFTGGVSGASFAPLAPAGSGTAAILPWAAGFNSASGNTTGVNSLVTADGTNGVRVLNTASASDFAILANGASLVPDQNNLYGANASSPAAIAANATVRVNSLVLSDGTTPNVSGGQGSVLQVFSGAIMTTSSGQSILTVPTIDFGSHTGYLYASSTMRVNSSLTGSAGLVASGYAGSAGGIFLIMSAPNPFTGGLTLNGSVALQFLDDRSLGATGGPITLGGGTLQYFNAGTLALNRPIFLTPAGGAFQGAGPNGIQSLITLNSSFVSGTGPLTFSSGVLAISGTTAGSWSTIVGSNNGGTVQFTGDGNFGSGSITLNGGTLQPTTATTFTRALQVNASSTIDVGGQSPTFSGAISTLGYTLAAGSPPTLSKAGAGTLTLTANSPFVGPVTVAAGTLTLSGANGRLANAVTATVNPGAGLVLDNTAANNADRYSGPVTLATRLELPSRSGP